MSKRTLLVTGASGQLGRRVVELLLQKKEDHVIAASRTPEKLVGLEGAERRTLDFDQPDTIDRAFAGVDRVLLVSTDALDRRQTQQRAAISAAKRAGVKHIVYTSMPNPGPENLAAVAPDHRDTEAALRESGVEYTILRNNMYVDLSLADFAHAVSTGVLRSAVGQGKIGYVTREDCAQAAAGALRSQQAGSRTLDVTGPSAISHKDVAAILSDVTGKPVRYEHVTVAQVIEVLQQAGLPAHFAALIASFDAAGAAGQLDMASDAVQSLSAHAPQSVRSFLEANRAALTH